MMTEFHVAASLDLFQSSGVVHVASHCHNVMAYWAVINARI